MRDGTDYFDDYADRKVSDSKPSGTVCRHCKKPENEHWGAKRHCLARYGKTLTIMDDKFEPLAETVCRCEGADSRGCAIHATPDYKPGGKMWREPAPAEQPRVHKNTYGGNDFVHCNDCGQEWDYRKPGTEPPTCIPVAASPAEGPRQCEYCNADIQLFGDKVWYDKDGYVKCRGVFHRPAAQPVPGAKVFDLHGAEGIAMRLRNPDIPVHTKLDIVQQVLEMFKSGAKEPSEPHQCGTFPDYKPCTEHSADAMKVEQISQEIAEKLVAYHLYVWQGLGVAIEVYKKEIAAILRPCFQADAPRLDSPKSCDFPFTESCTQFEACIRANRCLKNLPESERAKS